MNALEISFPARYRCPLFGSESRYTPSPVRDLLPSLLTTKTNRPRFKPFQSPDRIGPCTVKAVERCLQRGFRLEDVAIVSMRGRERSVLLGLDKLGSWTLRTRVKIT